MTGIEQLEYNGSYQIKWLLLPCSRNDWNLNAHILIAFMYNPDFDLGSRDIPDKFPGPRYDLVEIPKDDSSIHCQIRKISEYVDSNLQAHVCILIIIYFH